MQEEFSPKQTIRFCQSADGVDIGYAVSGKGKPLVRVTSWLSHLDYDWESPIWSHWFRELSRGHQLIRYDARGTGLSSRSVSDISLEAWLVDLEAVVADIGLETFDLLGLCQGGPVALAYAAAHPEQVDRLILYDSYLHGGLTDGSAPRVRKQANALADLIEVGWGQKTQAFHNVFSDLLLPDGPREARRWLIDLQRRTVEPTMAAALWRSFHHIDVRDVVSEVATPSLVLHVRGDQMVPFEQGRRLAASLADSRFVPLSGSNHILLESDRDWPRLLAEVRRFLGTNLPLEAGGTTQGLAEDLTQRQREVLELLAQGLDNKSIAEALAISSKTVRNHVSTIYRRLEVNSRAEAIVKARQAGLGRRSAPS